MTRTEPAAPSFPELLLQFRDRTSLSQEDLAAELSVAPATVSRWETGKTLPNKSTVRLLADLARKQGPQYVEIAEKFEKFGSPRWRERRTKANRPETEEPGTHLDIGSMERMLWKAACSIRGQKDAPKFKDYILPLLFLKRLSDVFEDELARLAELYGGEEAAREILAADHSLVRFFIPEHATWPVLSGRQQFDWPEREKPKTLGEAITTATRAIARENPSLQGVIDIVDFNETRNGEREISDEALAKIIELFSQPRYRLGLRDVEPDFLGRAYEYLLRKFAEGQGQSAGEFFTPMEVGWLISYLIRPRQGEEVYDYCCGSAGLLIKCELALLEREGKKSVERPLRLYGQELTGSSYAIARMNMVVHDMEGEIARGNTMTNPKFRESDSTLRRFDIVVANPMWNQNNISAETYESDPFERFSAGTPPESTADWAWLQHTIASTNENGRAAVVLDTGAVSRGSGNQGENREKTIRRWFVEQDLVEAILLLPDNLFYNTTAAGIIIILNRAKPKELKNRVMMINASGEYEKGRPKNFLPDAAMKKIADAFHARKDVDGFLKIASTEEIEKGDWNLSPSKFVTTTPKVEHRDIQQILDELAQATRDASAIEKDLELVFARLGYDYHREADA